MGRERFCDGQIALDQEQRHRTPQVQGTNASIQAGRREGRWFKMTPPHARRCLLAVRKASELVTPVGRCAGIAFFIQIAGLLHSTAWKLALSGTVHPVYLLREYLSCEGKSASYQLK